ncbi:MAG TPA: dihydropteroate synthase [Armatimonadota bacterium]|jgi:5-methyltetrahydrofolate--homocysteine methyltransferase
MIIIGELINGTRKRIKQAIAERDAAYIAKLAARQAEAGASFIDVNPGTVGDQEIDDAVWLVQIAQDATDKPLCIDTPNATAMEAAFEAYTGKAMPMLNSISLEAERLETMLPLIKRAKCNVIALSIGDAGMPTRAGDREKAALALVDLLISEAGLAPEQIYVDPIITPLSTQPEVVGLIAGSIRAILEHNPKVHITSGLSNISFGLPNRKLLNRVFVTLAMEAGMDSAVLDPLDEKIMAQIFATEALLGKDEYCMNYLTAFRQGKLEV